MPLIFNRKVTLKRATFSTQLPLLSINFLLAKILPKRLKTNGVTSEVKWQSLSKVVPPKKLKKSSRILIPHRKWFPKSMKALTSLKDLWLAWKSNLVYLFQDYMNRSLSMTSLIAWLWRLLRSFVGKSTKSWALNFWVKCINRWTINWKEVFISMSFWIITWRIAPIMKWCTDWIYFSLRLFGKYLAVNDLNSEKFWFMFGLSPESEISKNKFEDTMKKTFESKDEKAWGPLWSSFSRDRDSCNVGLIIKAFQKYESWKLIFIACLKRINRFEG